MSFCGLCGASNPAGSTFCGQCGRATDEPFSDPNVRATEPDAMTSVMPTIMPATRATPAPALAAPPPVATAPVAVPPAVVATVSHDPSTQSGRGGVMLALGLLGLVAVGGGIFLLTRSNDSPTSTAGPTSTSIAEVTTIAEGTTTLPSTIPVDPIQAAGDQLRLLVTQDRPTADTLVGSWVVQLSAKRVGLEADGIVYGPVEIVADHSTLRASYGAILVDSGAFQFQSGGSPMIGWFLTIVPEGHATKAEAAQWCTDRSLAANVCLAREFKPPTT